MLEKLIVNNIKIRQKDSQTFRSSLSKPSKFSKQIKKDHVMEGPSQGNVPYSDLQNNRICLKALTVLFVNDVLLLNCYTISIKIMFFIMFSIKNCFY